MRSIRFNTDGAEVTFFLRLEWKQNCHFGGAERRPVEPAPVTHLLRPTLPSALGDGKSARGVLRRIRPRLVSADRCRC
jgi:hypothetical protein